MQQQQEDREVYVFPNKGTKKRRVMTSELIGKFRSKSDFIKYLSENRKHSHSCDVDLCSSALRAACKDDQQRFPQVGTSRKEEATLAQRRQVRQRSSLRRTKCQAILANST